MKPFLALAGLALSAGLLTACTDDGYGRGSFYSSHGAYYGQPYGGWYDGYYGSFNDGYWGGDNRYYYRQRNDRRYRRDDHGHFRRDRHSDGANWRRFEGRHRGWDGRGRKHKD